MTTYQEQFQKAVEAEVIPTFWLAYFREAFRETINDRLLDLIDSEEITRGAIARKIGRRPEQLTRWINSPANLEADTISDLALAFGCEPKITFEMVSFDSAEDEEPSEEIGAQVLSLDEWRSALSDAGSYEFKLETATNG
jgi:plasmid maintenance system antidote protein VapI